MAFFINPIVYGGKTPTAEELKAAMLLAPAAEYPDLKTLGFQIQEGVKSSTVSYSLSAARKITRRDTGCGSFTPTGDLLTMGSNTITVNPLMVQLQECADRYDGTILEMAKKKGHATDNDLTGTVIEEIVREALTPAVYDDAMRIMLLGDRASSDVNYNQVDGLRKQLLAKSGAGKIVKGAAIVAADIEADAANALAVLEDLYKKQTGELKNVAKGSKVFFVDEVLYDAIEDARINYGSGALESGKAELFSGVTELKYRGILVKPLPMYHAYSVADFPANSPHIAILTVPSNIILATDLESDLAEITLWYDIKERFNYSRVLYRMGVGFGFDSLVVFAV